MLIFQVHFEDNQFELKRADGRKLLKRNAIPTVFNQDNPQKGRAVKRLATQHSSAKTKLAASTTTASNASATKVLCISESVLGMLNSFIILNRISFA